MKKILSILLLVTSMSFAQNQKYFNPNVEFKNGDTAYLYGDNVKLRFAPSTDSKTITLLPIGSEITIVSKSAETMLYDGLDRHWYYVNYNDKKGYILDGLLAFARITVDNLHYLTTFKEKDDIVSLKVRILEKGKPYLEVEQQLSTIEFTLKGFSNRGLNGVKSILLIDYLAEACGVDGGGEYIFFDGNKLVNTISFTQVSDAGVHWFYEEYIFPDEENGIPGKIIYQQEKGEYIDEETNYVSSTRIQRELEWKNNRLFPDIETMEN